ncbi:MAG: hypothetical protein KAJ19_26150 [Gammaproteobacteria bacterium]|nr:hypothetical protein [Gammaproteobacteria bacterium]
MRYAVKRKGMPGYAYSNPAYPGFLETRKPVGVVDTFDNFVKAEMFIIQLKSELIPEDRPDLLGVVEIWED